MEKKVNLDGNAFKEGVAIIREGKAQDIFNPKNINITGTLRAPFEFLLKKMAGNDATVMGPNVDLCLTEAGRIYNPKRSHLLVDPLQDKITLYLNEKDNFQDVITGVLKQDASWQDFEINTDTRFTLNEVISLVKKHKFKFKDDNVHTEFLKNLNQFNAKVTTIIKQHREQNGSSLDMVQKQVAENKNAPQFQLNVPIYQGYEKRIFTVQTCLEAGSNSVEFYFESVDLYELLDSERERCIQEELKKFSDSFDCSIVRIS